MASRREPGHDRHVDFGRHELGYGGRDLEQHGLVGLQVRVTGSVAAGRIGSTARAGRAALEPRRHRVLQLRIAGDIASEHVGVNGHLEQQPHLLGERELEQHVTDVQR